MARRLTGQQRELSALICESPRAFVTRMMFDPPIKGEMWFMWESRTRWREFARGGRYMPRVGE